MKKILGLIGAIGLTASTIATGVAATPVQTTKRNVIRRYGPPPNRPDNQYPYSFKIESQRDGGGRLPYPRNIPRYY